MAKEQKKRKFNPSWPSAQADTAERRTETSRQRTQRLNEIAHAIGYDSWRKLETAVLNGEAKVEQVNPTAIIV